MIFFQLSAFYVLTTPATTFIPTRGTLDLIINKSGKSIVINLNHRVFCLNCDCMFKASYYHWENKNFQTSQEPKFYFMVTSGLIVIDIKTYCLHLKHAGAQFKTASTN